MANVPTRPQGLLPKVRRFVERLEPYQSLVLLLIPVSLVEPLTRRGRCCRRRSLDHRHGHDYRCLCRQPAARRAIVRNGQA
jgi:hypothetical protein